jgi:hypothetical protein
MKSVLSKDKKSHPSPATRYHTSGCLSAASSFLDSFFASLKELIHITNIIDKQSDDNAWLIVLLVLAGVVAVEKNKPPNYKQEEK